MQYFIKILNYAIIILKSENYNIKMETEQQLIGTRIKNARKSQKLSQEQLCALAELDQSTLSRIENGDGFPSLANFISILNVLHLEPNFILDFICYESNPKNDNVDLLILEYIKTLNIQTKKKILELIQTIQ